ncbi:right-handed parallel beta-helix repeat-containing protein [Herbidospora sp. RD11066]
MRIEIDIDKKTLIGAAAGAAFTILIVVVMYGIFGGGGQQEQQAGGPAVENIAPDTSQPLPTLDNSGSGAEEDFAEEEQVEEDKSKNEDFEVFTASQQPPDIAVPDGDGKIACPDATVTVTNADELTEALASAEPGTVIFMEPGEYQGHFVAATKGTKDQPIFVCGSRDAIIDGGGVKEGYAFHLNEVDYWRLIGFTVRHAQKGVMADKTNFSVVQDLDVNHIGDEGIHFRNFSSDNIAQYNLIWATGLRKDKYGEGVYFGTAESNWATFSGGQMDKSDRNIARGNVIRATAEAIDIKEGTSDGKIIGNIFDGSMITGDGHNDSWVDVKGNGYLIERNTGRGSPADGFQTHKIINGWGTGNTFRANVIDLGGSGGYGINDTAGGNTISCDNEVTGGPLTKKSECS